MIDAQIYALAGYATGELPPNVKDQRRAIAVYRTLIHAHARAYHIIKQHGAGKGKKRTPMVGMIYFFFLFQSKSLFIDRVITRQMEDLFNWNMLDALHTGAIDISVLLGPKVKERDTSLVKTLDWIGVNYYTRQIISFNPLKPGFINRTDYRDYPSSDMGWEIFPEGLYLLCRELARRYPGVPLMIAENGIADRDDSKRPRFIADHLAWAHRLIAEGCPLFGFTYWSLTDNWEWKEGFWPKFGLYRVDRKTMKRRETRSARLYRFIATNNRLPDEKEFTAIAEKTG
jgi:beta-glucosidase